MSTLRDILLFVGVVVAVVGVFQLSTAAGMITLGAALVGGVIVWSFADGNYR